MTVYLVGAGPGDPGLLTVRGAEVLARADFVIYDRLSIGALLELAPESAERINVGKAPGRPTMPQTQINALLVEHGRGGGTVVRLKGGDPFVFARGGEEAQALIDAHVPFVVVPGISSAIAVPAYAGIPVTMRHSSELFTVITGHEDPDKGGELDWQTVAKLGGTIVVLMGIARLSKIVDQLLKGGLNADTPVAVIRWGTRPEQHTTRATLGSILDHGDELESPSVIVIGKVAAARFDWFESRPLFGKRILVTRAVRQASELSDRLRDSGADVVEVPMIEIVESADGGTARRLAAKRVGEFDWLVFTSVNGVERFMDEFVDARALAGVKVAAVGSATARALARRSIVADLVPERFVAESLLDEFPLGGGRLLLAQAGGARDVLQLGLSDKGWDVEVAEVYSNKPLEVADEDLSAISKCEIVTFASASAVDRLVDAVGPGGVPQIVACIGPITADAARARGLTVDVVSEVHTIAGLVDAVVDHFSNAGRRSG